MKRKPGAHLSQGGIELARLVGETSGPFNLVVTSPIPRATETAVAMGHEVNETVELLGQLPLDVLSSAGWPSPFSRISHAVSSGGPAADFAAELACLSFSIGERVPESKQALIVTNGGFVELGAVAAAPDYSHREWYGAIGYGEGVKLTFDGRFTSREVLRAPDTYHLVEN